MSDEDDWFERALRELEEEPDDRERSAAAEPSAEDDADAPADEGSAVPDRTPGDGESAAPGRSPEDGLPETDAWTRPGDLSSTDDRTDTGDRTDTDDRTDTGDRTGTGDQRRADQRSWDDDPTSERGSEESPFAEDFASALENAPDPPGLGGDFDDFGGFGDADASDDFGGFGDADASDDFGGFGDAGIEQYTGGTAEPFDDAEFESDIDRIQIGIEGLDEMVLGGVPKRSLMVAIGSAGTGKTTFGLQFLEHALAEGGTGVYITLEESRERVLQTAEEKGWPFRTYEDEERLVLVDLDPFEMADSLASIRNDLPRLIDDFGADRLVLDSVSLLEMMYDHPARRRSEVFKFSRALKDAGVTTLLTSETTGDNPYVSRYGIVEYLADAVFILQYVRPSDFQETHLAIEIQKIRDANHSRETKPYEITNGGISVYRRANIF